MSADKRKAGPWTRPRTLLESVLADGLSAHREAIHEALRRIPALESSRNAAIASFDSVCQERMQLRVELDQLRAEVQRWSVLAASFEAERNLLREEISDLHKANAARKDTHV